MKTFNPIKFANDVNLKFLNYQLTTFELADPDLSEQARELLKGSVDFQPLIKGPYVSVSRSFKWGRNLNDLVSERKVHPALPGLAEFPQMFAHQDKALEEISKGNHCLISTGTGSGKTEAFLYPILDHCLHLRDEEAPEGIVAIIVYPMNALAFDQLSRLRRMLVGSGISFGMYIGTTAPDKAGVKNVHKMNPGEGKREYLELEEKYKDHEQFQISPAEERITEKEINESPPRILLTNVKQLELLMTRVKDIKIFLNAPLKYLVFDEAHSYSGVAGAEVSCLVRRLRSLTGKTADDVICIGTSATIVEPELGDEAGRLFAQRFFGIDKDKISLIQEEYEEEVFPEDRYNPKPPSVDTVELFDKILNAFENDDYEILKTAYSELTGKDIDPTGEYYSFLFEELKKNNYIYALFHHLKKALDIREAVQRVLTVLQRKDRSTTEKNRAEFLCYLAFGAAAQREGNPLLRPKLHYFVKGLDGAVAGFTKNGGDREHTTKLFLSKQRAMEQLGFDEKSYLSVFVCKTCGQHYFESYHHNLSVEKKSLSGGQAEGNNVIWLPGSDTDGDRVILTDRFVSEMDDEEGFIADRLEDLREEVYFCAHCDTLQRVREDKCANPRCKRVGMLVKLYAVLTLEDGQMATCPSCKARGKMFGRFFEPIRPFRAVAVSDVHILGQNIINAASDDNQKLIVFSDNRQDAAFQAGWMQDHARRYRFRHLIYEYLKAFDNPVSIGDIQNHLYQTFQKDKSLGMVLAPEVYEQHSDESFGTGFSRQLKYYLRIQVLRELGTSFNQKEGMEPWGILKVLYDGISPDDEWIQSWAEKLKISVEDLVDGIINLIDVFRRNRYFTDAQAPIYSKLWSEGDIEVQNGYLPLITGQTGKPIPPRGMVEYPPDEKSSYKVGFRSRRAQSLSENYISKWIEDPKLQDEFLNELWDFLVHKRKIIRPVSITSSQGRVLASDLYQVDSAKIGLTTQWVLYRCNLCQRIHTRNNPNGCCTAMRCRGSLIKKVPSDENYNISLLSGQFAMLKPHEHTAQVPAKTREQVETEFKKSNGKYNTLVATPTLELGVDIGALDMVLMRNMPPKPSNYWQRAGRAGRRQKLAVVYTYARRSDHDRYYFDDPAYMLEGIIATPKFNLRNEVMLRKHIHATVLSELIRVSFFDSAKEEFKEYDIEEIREVLFKTFPNFIREYLFDEEGNYLDTTVDVTGLNTIIQKRQSYFEKIIHRVFEQYWPEEDREILTGDLLRNFLLEMPAQLHQTINLLHLRMMWAVYTQRKYTSYLQQRLLRPEEQRILQRCGSYLRELNQTKQENYTLNVLANEGFLPAYGLYDFGVKAFAHQSFIGGSKRKPDFELSRAPAIALREFIPGNLLYANGGRFRAVLYRFPAVTDKSYEHEFSVNPEKRLLLTSDGSDKKIGYSDPNIKGITCLPISDLDVHYVSRISDEEHYRFQLPVAILGRLRISRRGGKEYSVNGRKVRLLFGQKFLLVNIGPKDLVANKKLGYPICSVCGATRSPYASDTEFGHFKDFHKERCGKEPDNVGLTADVNVDSIFLRNLEDEQTAVNLGESIIIGATQILDMERNDLSIIVIPEDVETYSVAIYDPMPGGSGLLNQVINKWDKVIQEGEKLLQNCENNCEASCYSCMRTYYNVFNHSLFDRNFAVEKLKEYQGNISFEYDLEPEEELGEKDLENKGTNPGEISLFKKLQDAGFPQFETQKRIEIGPPYYLTVPDLYYEDEIKDVHLAVYLDSLSDKIHGNVERKQVDRVIRQQLESLGYDVLEIATSDLNDPEVFNLQLKRIAAKMKRMDLFR